MSYKKFYQSLINVSVPEQWSSVISNFKKYLSNTSQSPQIKTHVKNIASGLIEAINEVRATPLQKSQLNTLTNKLIKKYNNQITPGLKNQLRRYFQQDQFQKNVKPGILDRQQKKQNQHQSSIQSQIQPIRQLISVKISPNRKVQDIKQTLSLLDKYSQKRGRHGMGKIHGHDSQLFLGRRKQTVGNQQIFVLPPAPLVQPFKNPDIKANFNYYSDNVIFRWNQFIKAQKQWVNFINQVNTQQKRIQFTQVQIKQNTYTTFKCEFLATLCYYYFHLVMFNVFQQQIPDFTFNQGNFISNYQIKAGLKYNPLNLTNQQGLMVLQQLMANPSSIDQKYQSMLEKLQAIPLKVKGTIITERFKKLFSYINDKSQRSLTFYTKQGISPQTIKKTLEIKIAYNVYLSSSFFPSAKHDSYLNNMLNRLIKGQQPLKSSQYTDQLRNWDYNINSPKYPAKDYVFENQY